MSPSPTGISPKSRLKNCVNSVCTCYRCFGPVAFRMTRCCAGYFSSSFSSISSQRCCCPTFFCDRLEVFFLLSPERFNLFFQMWVRLRHSSGLLEVQEPFLRVLSCPTSSRGRCQTGALDLSARLWRPRYLSDSTGSSLFKSHVSG